MKYLRYLAPSLLFASSALAQGDLAALLQTDPELSTLLTAIGLVPGLNDTLSTASNITIFAPTNEAFTALPEDSLEGQAVAAEDVNAIAALLSLHVVQGQYNSTSIPDETPAYVQTLLNSTFVDSEDQPFSNTTDGQPIGVVLNGQNVSIISGGYSISEVTEADMTVGEIVIHKVNQVLRFAPTVANLTARSPSLIAVNAALQLAGLAGEGVNTSVLNAADQTFFLPINSAFENIGSLLANATPENLTSILAYHIVPDIVFAVDLGNFTAPSVAGPELNFTVFPDGSAFVNGAEIIFPNILLSNGVAHIIDTVLNSANTTGATDSDSSAEDRVQYETVTATESLAFTTYSVVTETYTTPALLSTIVAIASPDAAPTSPPTETDAASMAAFSLAFVTLTAGVLIACIVL